MTQPDQRYDSDVADQNDELIGAPGRFHVVLYNDDYTTMEFVQEILQAVFYHTPASASQLMLFVHTKGRAVAGTFTKDIAETKAAETVTLARSKGFPLRCSVEPA